MKNHLLTVTILFFLIFLSVTRTQTFTLQHDGVTRSYLVHVSTLYTGTDPVPLVMAFNGWYQTSQQLQVTTRLSLKADNKNFIAVYPQGITPNYNAWNDSETSGPDDVGFVSQMLDSLIARYNIDTTKIFATGFSSGAGMCYRLAQQLSNRIAAIAPVAGCTKYSFTPTKKIPIVQFKSKNDNYTSVFPVLNYWKTINNCAETPDTFFSVSGAMGEIWRSTDSDANVVLYSTQSGGHNWPTLTNPAGPISATDLMIEFFENPNPSATNLEQTGSIPTNFILEQNYPNPFNPDTKINFSLPKSGVTSLRIYDILGKEVAELVNENLPTGNYSIAFNAERLASGIYFYQLVSDGNNQIKKMILMK